MPDSSTHLLKDLQSTMDDDEVLGFEPGSFSLGAIRKLVFHRFLTYEHVVVKPGPHMNVILGPNGTGKSTIICGICLASGGSPKLLGRSDKLGDYISHGKLDGWVEMNLHDPDAEEGVVCFKIMIRKPNNASYYIDGRKVTQTAVREAIARYNIQVDNPCTFLAQDKVKSFAEQSEQQLLWNTEKAGPKELLELHNELIQKSEKGNNVEVLKKEQEEKLKRIRESIDRVRPLAENYKERRRRNKHLQAFKDKVVFLEAQSSNELFVEKKAATVDVQKRIDKINAEKREIDREMQAARAQMQKVDLTRLSTRLNQLKNTFSEKSRNLGDCFDNDNLESARRQLALLQTQYDNWEKEIKTATELRDNALETLKEAEAIEVDDAPLNAKRAELSAIVNKLQQETRMIDMDRRELLAQKRNIENRLHRHQQEVREKVVQIAKAARNRDIVNAWEYYTNNRNEFRHPVYLPFTCIEVSQANLCYFNNVFGVKDMAIFVFGCREDEMRITTRNFRINTTVFDYKDEFEIVPLRPALSQLGFHDYMINMFKAPRPVKAFLNNVYGLNQLPVGNENVDRNSEQIAHTNRELRLFLTNRSRIQVLSSYYNPNRLTVKRSNLRNFGPLGQVNTVPLENQARNDMKVIDEKLKSLDNRQRENSGLVRQKEVLEAEFNALKAEHTTQINSVGVAQQQFDKFDRLLRAKKDNKPDIEQAKAALEQREKISRMRLPEEFHKICEMSNDYYTIIKDCVINEATVARHKVKFNHFRDKQKELEWNLQEVNSELQVCKNEENAVKRVLDEKLRDFKESCDISHIDEAKLSIPEKAAMKKLKQRWQQYNVPENIDECNEEIANEEVRNEVAQLQGSLEDVNKLLQLEQDEVAMSAELEKSQHTIDNWETDMKTLLEKWIHPLRELVEQISTNFSNFFSQINFAGQVVLDEPEDPLRIDKYGIDILVQFKGYKSLHRLTGQQQSGGERSVSTMLYLMALQELCPVPFRCVDEINQGMDPSNERLVFNMMVDLISGSGHLGKTQYFILTPKLLPGLNFTEKVTVLIIQNSFAMSQGTGALAMHNEDEDAGFEDDNEPVEDSE